MRIKDLLSMEIDIDCYDNVVEEMGIAYCGPMALTEEGQKEFSDVMEYECEILPDPIGYDVCIVKVDDDPNIPWREKLNKVNRFFKAIAGYCDCDDYDKWFTDIE